MNFLKNIAAGLISLTMLSSVRVGASSVPYLQGDIDYDEAVALSDAVSLPQPEPFDNLPAPSYLK